MGKKKGDGGLGVIGFIVVAIGAAIAAIPKEIWILIGVCVLIWVVWRLFGPLFSGSSQAKSSNPSPDPPRVESAPTNLTRQQHKSGRDQLYEVTLNFGKDQAFPIRQSSASIPNTARWHGPGEKTQVHGFDIPGGMLYVGGGMFGASGSIDAALIDPACPIADEKVDISLRLMDYWPNYSRISDDARRGYLQWLAGGRADPSADIGYVFLFFYGLERRLLADTKAGEDLIAAEYPALRAEVERLLKLYPESGSWRRYATEFLAITELLYRREAYALEAPPPEYTRSFETPMGIRVGLAEFAVKKHPLPAPWALAWVLSTQSFSVRTPAFRCPEVFAQVFSALYREKFGEGLLLPTPRTRLKAVYRPASPSFGPGYVVQQSLSNLPDVSVSAKTVAELQRLVDAATEAISPYSRYIGRNPTSEGSLEALLQLPTTFWPLAASAELNAIREQVGDGVMATTLGELSGRLKSAGAMNREKVMGFARALAASNIGLEPDVLSGAKLPKPEDKLVLFAVLEGEGSVQPSDAYRAAALTVALAISVAAADGATVGPEISFVSRQIDAWTHLSASHRKRLKAFLRLQIDNPAKLSSLKKPIEQLGADAKRTLAHYLAMLAQADGTVTPAEVKFLEKTYKALGVEVSQMYSDLHIAAAGGAKPSAITSTNQPLPSPTKEAEITTGGFSLDPERIAALKRETEEVSKLLATVFTDDQDPSAKPEDDEVGGRMERVVEEQRATWGLPPDQAAFLHAVLQRASWTRAELEDLAADMSLMLDGTMEALNEAALDHAGEVLFEGEDPVDVNQSLLEATAT